MAQKASDKFVRRNSTLEAIESLGASDLVKVKEYVDDDLLSCFLWAAGENAITQQSWDAPTAELTPEIEHRQILPPVPAADSSLPEPDAAAAAAAVAAAAAAAAAVGGEAGAAVDAAVADAAAAAVQPADAAGAAAAAAAPDAAAAAAAAVAAAEAAAEAAAKPAAAAAPVGTLTRQGAAAAAAAEDDDDDSDDDGLALAPTTPGGGPSTPLTKEDKLLQRMQRKAESARIARLRKKEYVSGLEEQLAQLGAELKSLEAAVEVEGATASPAAPAAPAAPPPAKPGVAETPGLKQEEASGLSQMDALLRRPSVERLTPELQSTIEQFVTSKRKRFDTISDYLDCIQEVLQPGTPVQMAFGPSAAMAAANSGAPSDGGPLTKRQRRDSSAGAHLLETLTAELGITPQQRERLIEHRDAIRKDRELLLACENILTELRARISEHSASSQSVTDGLRRILTPQQTARFLSWVEKNRKRMELLNAFDWEKAA